jgi:segregation and condensation protein B
MEDSEIDKVIEAALFMASRPLSIDEIGKLIGVAAPGFVTQRVKALSESYSSRQSALEIVEEEGKFHMRVRSQFMEAVKPLAQAAEISRHALRTLAYISKNEGMKKSDLCEKLGSGIYDDVHELREKGFVHQKKSGRSTLLSTTQKFREYFGQQ